MNEFAVTTPKPKDVPRPLAKRSAIDPFIVMDVMGEANARELKGHDIIHMEVGQPATPAPRAARERAQQALESERLGYTEALGLPKLRADCPPPVRTLRRGRHARARGGNRRLISGSRARVPCSTR